MKRKNMPLSLSRNEVEKNDNASYDLHKSYFAPLNDTKQGMTACASSTINLDSLLANIGCNADKEVHSGMTADTSACSELSSSNSIVSRSSSTNFSAFSSQKRNRGRMLRSARYSSHLSSLSSYCSDDESIASSTSMKASLSRCNLRELGIKRSLCESEENNFDSWGHFVDNDTNDGFKIDFNQDAIAAVLDESSWGYFADTSD